MPANHRNLYARTLPIALMAAAAAGVGGLTGCSVQRAHTVPFDGTDNRGIVYSVPKTYLSITVQYAYTRDDLRPGPPEGHLQGALKIAPVLVPDEKSTFLIKTDGLMRNAMFLTSVNFRFNNGTLESVDSTTVDRTGEVIKQLGETAVNIAKAAAKGDATPHEKAILAAERRIDEIYAAIAQAAAQPVDAPRGPGGGGGGGPSLDALQKELDVTRRLILDLRTNVDPPLRTVTAPFNVLVDPDDPTHVTADYLEYEVKPPQLFPDVPEDNMDVLYIRIYDCGRRNWTQALHADRSPRNAEGIIYRQPVPLMTKILSGIDGDDERHEVFSGLLPFAQFSAPSVAVLDAKVLTSKHTALVIDTVNGGLISFGDSQDSAVVNAATATNELSRAVVDAENATKPQPVGRGATSGTGTGTGGSGGSSRGGSTGTGGSSGGTGGSSGGTGGSSGGTNSSRSGTSGSNSTPPSTPAVEPSTQPTTRTGRGGGRGGAATNP